VSSGGIASGTILDGAATQAVSAGGLAVSTIVSSGDFSAAVVPLAYPLTDRRRFGILQIRVYLAGGNMPFDQLRRREFLGVLGGAAAAWPRATWAQQSAMPIVGFLNPIAPGTAESLVAAFHRGLGQSGYVEGRNVAVKYRWGDGALERLPELAADLVREKVAVIVTPGSLVAARAAKAATSTVPIVFGLGSDPVRAGLVSSLNRPGGNATGFVELYTEIASKRLGLLHDLLPGASRFALLVDPTSGGGLVMPELEKAASANQLQIEPLVVAGAVDAIDGAFASLKQKRIDGLMASPSPLFYPLRVQIAGLALRHTVPVIYWDRAFVEAGGLMSYGTSVADMFRQVGIYAGRILKGEKPADMPVMQATRFELVINHQIAKALGLTVPPILLTIADEVIE
jgi:putative ABC transport system substrate-binding protein